jgi:NADPH:quinone reductase
MKPVPMSFRKWQIETYNGPLTLVTVNEKPKPGPNQLLLKVLATDSTYTDCLVLSGNYPIKLSFPITPGYDCVAIVESIGEDVTSFSVNDIVISMPKHGCASEFTLVSTKDATKINSSLAKQYILDKPEIATSIGLTGITAYQMLHRVMGEKRLNAPNSAILVQAAAGGTGAMLCQLAKIAGLIEKGRIVGTCSRKNMNKLSDMGIVPICYEDADFFQQAVAASPGGKGFDAVFDSVSTNEYYCKGVASLKPKGIYCYIGFTDKKKPGIFPMEAGLVIFQSFVRGFLHFFFGAAEATMYLVTSSRDANPQQFDDDVRTLIDMTATGVLNPVIGKIWSFEKVNEALQSIRDGNHTGKQNILVTRPQRG